MKKTILLVIVFILLFNLVSCSVESKIGKINKYITEEEYDKAQKIIDKLLLKEENNKEIYDLKLEIDRKTNNKDKLIDDLIIAIELFNSIDYKKELLDIYIEKNLLDMASEVIISILEIEKTTENYRILFDIYSKLNKKDSWIDYYEINREDITDNSLLLETAKIYLDNDMTSKSKNIIDNIDIESLNNIKDFEILSEYYYLIQDYNNSYNMAIKGIPYAKDSTILYGYKYGLINADGLNMIKILNEDINGDGFKENIILLGETKDLTKSRNNLLTIQNGRNGNLIIKKWLNSYTGYDGIIFEDFNGDKIKDIYINTFSENKVPKPEIYMFNNNNFKSFTEQYSYNDIKYELKDDFKFTIYSQKANKEYLISLDKVKEKLINNSIYDQNGKLLNANIIKEYDEYQPIYIEKLNYYGINKNINIEVQDITIGEISLVYYFKDNLFIFDDFILNTKLKKKKNNYNKNENNFKINFEIEDLSKILNFNKKTIYETLGNPKRIEFQKNEILNYEGIQFFLENNSDSISRIKITNSENVIGLKIPTNYINILDSLGEPTEEITARFFKEETELIYFKDNIKITFIGNKDKKNSFIIEIERE